MKLKTGSLILLFVLLSILGLNRALGSTPMTGTAYGEKTGLYFMDYTTSINHSASTNKYAIDPASPEYANYLLGARKEFYISPQDAKYGTIPEHSGDASLKASISDLGDTTGCDKNAKTCLLNGFIWSNQLGWIILDGSVIASALGAGEFPTDDYAKTKFDPSFNMKALFTGYIWSEKTGWIELSDGSGALPPSPQTATQFGVYLDANDAVVDVPNGRADCDSKKTRGDCEAVMDTCDWNTGTNTCDAKLWRLGRQLHGYAWSEKLGWIKFGKEATDDVNFGVYTRWVPDTTPPEMNVTEDHIWFANSNIAGSVAWPQFATDPESGIDWQKTTITVTKDANQAFAGCFDVTVKKYVPENDLTLNMLKAGLVANSTDAFCKYTLTGKVVNGAGLTFYIGDPGNTLAPEIKSDPKQYRDTINFYTRAGALSLPDSSMREDGICPHQPSAIADGKDCLEYLLEPNDIAGNPILPVKVGRIVDTSGGTVPLESDSSKWMRNVVTDSKFDAELFYDSVKGADGISYPYALPIKIGAVTYALTIPSNYQLDYEIPEPTIHSYHVETSSYAPTTDCGTNCANKEGFKLNAFQTVATDAEMPAITKNVDPTPAQTITTDIDKNATIQGGITFPVTYAFKPALALTSAKLKEDVLTSGVPNDVSLTLKNQSQKNFDALGVDNIFAYSGGFSALLDVRNINLSGDSKQASAGRTDPVWAQTNYETASGLADRSVTAFHNADYNFYPYTPFYKSVDPNVASSVGSDGIYEVSGIYDLDPKQPLPPSYPPINILRSDTLGSLQISSDGTDVPIYFTPLQILNSDLKSAVFGINNYVAYRMEDQSLLPFTVYEPDSLINNVSVKNIGVEYTGIGAGQNIYQTGGREFQSVGAAGTEGLKEQINRNVAELTTSLSACPAASLPAELPVTGGCVRVDDKNKTVVAYYTGSSSDAITIGTGPTYTLPDYKYTLILKGGVNVLLPYNLKYNLPSASFGMILLSDANGKGANIFVDPGVTNLVGTVYAEGSILSSADGTTFYYGPGSASAAVLKNQLYWQGSIASLNTIGGATNNTVPTGVTTFPDGTLCTEDYKGCAQMYDMDYIRRFTVTDDTTVSGYFSGGGSCAAGTCTAGLLPSKIVITSDQKIDLTNSKKDPFYVEKDNRLPPPGFTTSSGTTQTQEIR